MKLRCELHLKQSGNVILVARPEETLDHLAMKLAAFAMFLTHEPIVEPSSDHPALLGSEYRPDLCALNVAGEVDLWVECGAVTLNKIHKVTRQFPHARIVVLKAKRHEAERLRRDMVDVVRNSDRIEIWTWPDGSFDEWKGALEEKTELYGEAGERTFNLVVNHTAYAVDLVSV